MKLLMVSLSWPNQWVFEAWIYFHVLVSDFQNWIQFWEENVVDDFGWNFG
jgi:hypothetical protein